MSTGNNQLNKRQLTYKIKIPMELLNGENTKSRYPWNYLMGELHEFIASQTAP
jgi:hypothetical protein